MQEKMQVRDVIDHPDVRKLLRAHALGAGKVFQTFTKVVGNDGVLDLGEYLK